MTSLQSEAQTVSVPVNKKIGGTERAEKARKAMTKVFTGEDDPLYFAKDIEFARKFDVSRLTIYHIRDQLKVPSRSERIIKKLKKINLPNFTIKQLAEMLNLKYQNLYKIVTENHMRTKPDIGPEEARKKTPAN